MPFLPTRQPMKKKRTLYKMHSISGLLAGLFVLGMSVSGSLLVFHEEWDRWKQPVIQNEPDLPLLSVDSCYQLIRNAFPNARISQCNLPENSRSPFRFVIYDTTLSPSGLSSRVYIHPQNGKLLSVRTDGGENGSDWMKWLSGFHNSLLLNKTGEWLLGVFSLLFLFSLVSGCILYRKSIIAVLLFRKRFLRKENLHQRVGVYALLFNLMIALTGFWMQRYVFSTDFYKTYPAYRSTRKPSPALNYFFSGELQVLKDSFPAFTPYVIYFPSSSGGNTAIYGSRSTNSFIHNKKLADALFLDSTGRLYKTAFVTEISPQNRYDIINAQIHYGRYGGLPVKLAYSLLGMTAAVLSISGFLIWLRKKSITDN